MQVQVNGQTYNIPNGANISIINNVLYIDGKKYEGDGYEEKHFKIEITGGVANVKVERGDVTVNGDVSGGADVGGNINVSGKVDGKVDAGGNVTCGDVKGDVDAGGNVKCGNIVGDVDAGGNVRHA